MPFLYSIVQDSVGSISLCGCRAGICGEFVSIEVSCTFQGAVFAFP